MTHRLKAISDEEKNLEAIRRVCENLKQCHLPFDAVSESILEGAEKSWSEQLAKVLKEDITKELLTPKQFNQTLTLMLCWGYFLCEIVSFFFGSRMLSYSEELSGLIFIPIFLAIVCYIIMYFTSNMKTLLVLFHISALNLSPIIASIYMFFNNPANRSLNGLQLTVFWLMIIIYVITLYLLSNAWKRFFQKARNVIITAVSYTAIMTLMINSLTGLWLISLIGFFPLTMFIGLNWFHAYQISQGCNRYYAVIESCQIMNFFGSAFNMKGITIPPYVQR